MLFDSKKSRLLSELRARQRAFYHVLALVCIWCAAAVMFPHVGYGYGSSGGNVNFIAVSASHSHTVALKNDGTVWTWGANNHGQLGYDTSGLDQVVPKKVAGLDHVVSVAAGGDPNDGSGFTVALQSDGTVWTWGSNSKRQLGNGGASDTGSPVKVMEMVSGYGVELNVGTAGSIASVAAGFNHAAVLTENGRVYVWGDNQYGQLGLGSGVTNSQYAKLVVDNAGTGTLSGIKQISLGGYHSLALTVDGNVWAWGENSRGQLGVGDTNLRTKPQLVLQPAAEGSNALAGIRQISAGSYHSVAIYENDSTRFALGWGSNQYGQLGIGATSLAVPLPQYVMVNAADPETTAVRLAAGGDHTLITLGSAGAETLASFGRNDAGQQGRLEMDVNTTTLTAVYDLPMVSGVAAGEKSSFALDSSGRLYAWGDNQHSQLGTGGALKFGTPTPVSFDGVVVAASNYKEGASGVSYKISFTPKSDITSSNRIVLSIPDEFMDRRATLNETEIALNGQSIESISNDDYLYITPKNTVSAGTLATLTFNSGSGLKTVNSYGAYAFKVRTDNDASPAEGYLTVLPLLPKLISLSVSDVPIDLLSSNDQQYKIDKESTVSSIVIKAAAQDGVIFVNHLPYESAGISLPLEPGTNAVTIEVRAANGNIEYYFLRVNRGFETPPPSQEENGFRDYDYREMVAVRPTSDGGYIMILKGSTYVFSDNTYKIGKTDASGNLLWVQTYPDNVADVLETSPGKYLLMVNNDSGVSVVPIVLKPSPSNENLFQVLSSNLMEPGAAGWSLASTQDGFIAAATAASPDGRMIVIKGTLSSDGSVTNITKDYFSAPTGWNISRISGIKKLAHHGPGDQYAIAANINVPDIEEYAVYLWKITAGTTSLIKENELIIGNSDSDTDYSSKSAYGVTETEAGNIVIAGSDSVWLPEIYQNFNIMWVAQLKSDFSGTEWQNMYMPGEVHSIDAVKDGGFIIAGQAAGLRGLAIKLDRYGGIVWAYSGVERFNAESYYDRAIQTQDGGYFLTGRMFSEVIRAFSEKLKGPDVSLSTLSVTPLTEALSFNSETLTYNVKAAAETSSVVVTPTLQHGSFASIKVNGVSTADGTSQTVALTGSVTPIYVEVTGYDNATKRTYTVNVQRAASGETGIEGIYYNGTTLSRTENAFNLSVPYNTTSVTLNVTTKDENAQIGLHSTVTGVTYSGKSLIFSGLVAGESKTANLVVYAPNGTASQEYPITVTTAPDPNSSMVSEIKYKDGAISRAGSSFTLSVPYEVTAVALDVGLNNEAAAISVPADTVTGVTYSGRTITFPSLTVGTNSVTMSVYAPNRAIEQYKIDIFRASMQQTVNLPKPDISYVSDTIKEIGFSNIPDGVSIYYTLDGSVPTSSSLLYDKTKKIRLEAKVVFKAIAVKQGMKNSDVYTYTFDRRTSAEDILSKIKGGADVTGDGVFDVKDVEYWLKKIEPVKIFTSE
ncbi:cadherin-like beta sandwich domain-containing protein [Paenibacillus hamazuiensis]|uniref:RCC1 domain-containing protein n=1 Tax=Paenibacillus hamazuiensis TaxID=2936508 RepID=UPI00200C48DA|nr:cadherin-like beta sandwich domain-containing protein [Paenibacillus hamazuiensis]